MLYGTDRYIISPVPGYYKCQDTGNKYYFGKYVKEEWDRLTNSRVYYTPLRECWYCKKISVPKKVQYRSECFTWSRPLTKSGLVKRNASIDCDAMLCTSCWTKARRIMSIRKEMDGIRKALRKFNTEVNKKCRK